MARVLIASGGTGGHFYPGYSLGKALRARGHDVLYLVRVGDPALPLLAAEGMRAEPLDVRGMPRALSPKLAAFLWKLGGAFAALRGTFASFRPDAVVGMGSYVSFPAVFTAWSRGVPAAIHESNACFGLANRLSVPFVRAVCLGLPQASLGARAAAKATLTGTPIREALWSPVDRDEAAAALGLFPDKRTVLVFGGSQGAERMNAALPAALAAVSPSVGGLQVLHLTGARRRAAVEADYRARGLPAVVLDYLEKMELAYAAADLVVSRSGASTLAELIALRKPALLIPFPFAAGKHQSANAAFLESEGAAVRLEEADLSEASAREILARLLAPSAGDMIRGDMARALERLKLPSGRAAVQALTEAVEELA